MFLRPRRSRHLIYTEALESYRAEGTIKYRHAARWPAHLTLAQAIAALAAQVAETARRSPTTTPTGTL